MANNLLQNPLVITAAMASGYKALTASTLGTLRTVRITKIYWENPASVGDTVNIEDPSSLITIANLRCDTANISQVLDWTARPLLVADFQVSQISSGTLYIYYADC